MREWERVRNEWDNNEVLIIWNISQIDIHNVISRQIYFVLISRLKSHVVGFLNWWGTTRLTQNWNSWSEDLKSRRVEKRYIFCVFYFISFSFYVSRLARQNVEQKNKRRSKRSGDEQLWICHRDDIWYVFYVFCSWHICFEVFKSLMSCSTWVTSSRKCREMKYETTQDHVCASISNKLFVHVRFLFSDDYLSLVLRQQSNLIVQLEIYLVALT